MPQTMPMCLPQEQLNTMSFIPNGMPPSAYLPHPNTYCMNYGYNPYYQQPLAQYQPQPRPLQ